MSEPTADPQTWVVRICQEFVLLHGTINEAWALARKAEKRKVKGATLMNAGSFLAPVKKDDE